MADVKKLSTSRLCIVVFVLGALGACSSQNDAEDVAAPNQEEPVITTSVDNGDGDPIDLSDEVVTVEVTAQGTTHTTSEAELEDDSEATKEDESATDAAGESDGDGSGDADSQGNDTNPVAGKPGSERRPEGPTGATSPDLVFDWTAEAKPTAGSRVGDFAGDDFWIRGINCSSDYNQAHADSTRVTFGVTTPSRFAGERSVEFFTDRSLPAPCNDHLVPHRAEMSISNNRTMNNRYARYRNGGGVVTENSPTLGIETGSVGSPGSVVWFGWSERYGEIDTSHTTTLWQLRSNCGTGSPAVALAYRPDSPYGKGEGIYLLTQSANGNVRDNYSFLAPLTAGGWRDFVMEVGYSYEDQSGFVKVWHSDVASNGRSTFDYNNPAVFRRSATLYGVDAPLPSNADNVDECPHLRWGLYRHDGSKVAPEQVPEANRVMTKYVSPVRLLVGRGLGQQGIDAVIPRPIGE